MTMSMTQPMGEASASTAGGGVVLVMAGAARWLRSGLACRLCRRVTAATFVAIFVIEAVILVPSYFRREGELLTRLEETSLAAARTAMRLTPRKDLAADIAASLGVSAGSTPLLGVTLYYPDGRFVDSFGEVPTLTPPIGPDWNGMAMARTGGSYEVAWTAATLESPFTMVARLDASMVDRELRAFVARIAGLVAVIALFVTAATMLILAYAVLGPVLALRNRLIAAGADPTQPESYLLGERADELGDVNRAFNAMIRRIAANIDAIENQRKQLAKAHDAVLRANQAKSDFLAGMSHELRTPLNAIIGFSELMRSQMFGPLGNPRYIEHAGIIHDSGNHLLELINGILDFSKAEAGRVELHVEETVFADLAEASVRMVGERAAKAGVALELQLPEPPVAIAVDGLRLKQVLLNLLTNAIKFTPSGGRVTLAAGLVPHGFQISVADTGIGIAPEDLERVMEPFGQARDSRVRDQEGTGLGLPLAKHLIELHGGLLTLASEYGRGTTVTATLPAACARPLRP